MNRGEQVVGHRHPPVRTEGIVHKEQSSHQRKQAKYRQNSTALSVILHSATSRCFVLEQWRMADMLCALGVRDSNPGL